MSVSDPKPNKQEIPVRLSELMDEINTSQNDEARGLAVTRFARLLMYNTKDATQEHLQLLADLMQTDKDEFTRITTVTQSNLILPFLPQDRGLDPTPILEAYQDILSSPAGKREPEKAKLILGLAIDDFSQHDLRLTKDMVEAIKNIEFEDKRDGVHVPGLLEKIAEYRPDLKPLTGIDSLRFKFKQAAKFSNAFLQTCVSDPSYAFLMATAGVEAIGRKIVTAFKPK